MHENGDKTVTRNYGQLQQKFINKVIGLSKMLTPTKVTPNS